MDDGVVDAFERCFKQYRDKGFSDKDLEEAIHDLAKNFRDTCDSDVPSGIDVRDYLSAKGVRTTRL